VNLFQVIKNDGVKIVIEDREDPLLKVISELLGPDNVIIVQGNRTFITFDGSFERFLLESIVAMKKKHANNTDDFALTNLVNKNNTFLFTLHYFNKKSRLYSRRYEGFDK
jgi:hypothetical protein